MKYRWLFGLIAVFFVLFLSFFPRHSQQMREKMHSDHHYRILVTHKQGLGEKEMAERVLKTAIAMGHECNILTLARISAFKGIARRITSYFIDIYSPDIILSLEGGTFTCTGPKKYAALTHGSDYYFSDHATLPFRKVANYDGFLISFPDRGTLKSYYALGNRSCHYMTWYSTCSKTMFKAPENCNLFYCGSNMAQTTYGQLFKTLFSMLDQRDYLHVYGNRDQWLHTPRSYKGFARHDGETILKKIHQSGVALILHSPNHFLGKTPNARIFEAAAASAVIICDRHQFIQDHFKDSVLYLDMNSPEQMAAQIDSHMEWIRSHPEEAKALAHQAHQIFVEKFSLENQLQMLFDLHQATYSN